MDGIYSLYSSMQLCRSLHLYCSSNCDNGNLHCVGNIYECQNLAYYLKEAKFWQHIVALPVHDGDDCHHSDFSELKGLVISKSVFVLAQFLFVGEQRFVLGCPIVYVFVLPWSWVILYCNFLRRLIICEGRFSQIFKFDSGVFYGSIIDFEEFTNDQFLHCC